MSKVYTVTGQKAELRGAEREKVRISASEMEGLKHLVALEEMTAHTSSLEMRLKGIPRGKLRLGQLRAAARSLINDIYATIPDRQRDNIMINFAGMGYTFGVRRPAGMSIPRGEYGLWVSDKFLAVCESAIREHCAVCNLDNQQQRSCPYAEIRDEMPGKKDLNARGCGYFGL